MSTVRRLTAQLGRLAALGEDPRRALYLYVLEQERPVSRDEAAAGIGISRPLAAYHLDKLADAGLLDVSFARRSGRQGPGAGRPSKLYRRAAEPVELTVPARDYAFMADLLARTVESAGGSSQSTLLRAAQQAGEQARPEPEPEDVEGGAVDALVDVLSGRGYEPYRDDNGTVRFRNCPFHRLAEDHRELVCSTNLAFVEGLTAPLLEPGMTVRLDPRPGECCVAIDTAEPLAAETSGPQPGNP